MSTIIDMCAQALGDNWQNIHRLVYYSHLVPVFLSISLAFLLALKAKKNLLSRIFIAFTMIFSIWLIGDMITWTSKNYYAIYATWSFLLYLEVVFYSLGLYFAIVFEKKSDISLWYKILIFFGTLTPFIFTIWRKSVTGFNYPICEAFNNEFLDQYKLVYEGIILAVILMFAIGPLFRKISWSEKRPKLVVLGSMFLFLSTFGATEYLAATTGYYEINLYSLFLMPVFLVAIIYSVFELDIFNVQTLGTHYLVVGLVVLMGGQLFFIENTTNRLLTIIAIVLAGALSVVLFRNLKKESDQRVEIAKLNVDLRELLKQRESLVHLVTHKVKGAFTRSKYIFDGIVDGTFGDVNDEVRKRAAQGLESDNMGIQTVDLVLNVANIQKGLVKYDMKPIDLKDIVLKTVSEKKESADKKALEIETDIKDGDDYSMVGDGFWIKEVVNNLVENSIRYSMKGPIIVSLKKNNDKLRVSVKDNGVGITPEDMKNLFTEGGRGKDSVKINVDSTGYGLYSVKLILDAHQGRVWAESAGKDKGSTFFVELPTTLPVAPVTS